MTENELKSAVVKLLVSDYDYDIDEASSAVEDSIVDVPDMWNENADANDLAKFLVFGEGNE